MLSVNLPLMKADLNSLLTASKGNPVYDAAYNAYYISSKHIIEQQNNSINSNISSDANIDPLSKEESNNIEKNLKEISEVFATEFCDNLKSSGFMDHIADEIDNHIKSMMLSINVPVIPPTLISPVGPVTGSLMISEMSGAQITIS